MGVHRACGEPDEIKKNTHPKNITALFPPGGPRTLPPCCASPGLQRQTCRAKKGWRGLCQRWVARACGEGTVCVCGGGWVWLCARACACACVRARPCACCGGGAGETARAPPHRRGLAQRFRGVWGVAGLTGCAHGDVVKAVAVDVAGAADRRAVVAVVQAVDGEAVAPVQLRQVDRPRPLRGGKRPWEETSVIRRVVA